MDEYPEKKKSKRPSRLWYLLPIFLGLLGGIAAYLLLQERDKKFAKRLLIVGLVMTVVLIVLNFVLRFIAYSYTSRLFESTTASMVEISDATCSNGVITAHVKNVGTESLPISNLMFYLDDSETSATGCSGNMLASVTTRCRMGSGLEGVVILKVVGPSNTVTESVFCP